MNSVFTTLGKLGLPNPVNPNPNPYVDHNVVQPTATCDTTKNLTLSFNCPEVLDFWWG